MCRRDRERIGGVGLEFCPKTTVTEWDEQTGIRLSLEMGSVHRIPEYPELEGIIKDHWSLGPAQDRPRNHHSLLRGPQNWCWWSQCLDLCCAWCNWTLLVMSYVAFNMMPLWRTWGYFCLNCETVDSELQKLRFMRLCDLARHPNSDSFSLSFLTSNRQTPPAPKILTRPGSKSQQFQLWFVVLGKEQAFINAAFKTRLWLCKAELYAICVYIK